MPLELMIALIVILPIIIFFVIFVWYLNLGQTCATVKETPHKRPALAGDKKPAVSRV
jgi:hypothetical protein